MYKVVHGWPMLAGVPVPAFLILMLAGVVGVFGVSMLGGLTGAGVVVVTAAASWGALAWLFGQDQVAVPLFFVKRRARLRPIISSYSPSWSGVDVDEKGSDW
jgi:hypothetical protein